MSQLFEFIGNHPFLFTALGVIVALIIANEIHGGMTAGTRLSPSEAVRLINDRDPLVLDVRPVPDFKRGHLLGAQNVPLAKLDAELGRLAKQPERPVLVYCALGGSSLTAAQKLRQAGIKEVYPLRGGINAWLNASLPVTAR